MYRVWKGCRWIAQDTSYSRFQPRFLTNHIDCHCLDCRLMYCKHLKINVTLANERKVFLWIGISVNGTKAGLFIPSKSKMISDHWKMVNDT